MSITVTEKIPVNRWRQFHEILIATNGRYLSNPIKIYDMIHLHYEPGDYKAQCEMWNRVTVEIKETRRDQFWRRILRRLKFWRF